MLSQADLTVPPLRGGGLRDASRYQLRDASVTRYQLRSQACGTIGGNEKNTSFVFIQRPLLLSFNNVLTTNIPVSGQPVKRGAEEEERDVMFESEEDAELLSLEKRFWRKPRRRW